MSSLRAAASHLVVLVLAAGTVVAVPGTASADEASVSTAPDGSVTYVDPVLADEPTRRVEGTLYEVAIESGPERPAVIVTTDGALVPVELSEPVEAPGGRVVAELVEGSALTDALDGRPGEPVEVASADVAQAETSTAAVDHRTYVAVVANSGTVASDATVNGLVDDGNAWWTAESGGSGSFTRTGTTVRYDSGLSAAQRCGINADPFPLWAEAAQRFPGVDFLGGTGNHLVVVVASSCAGTGIGTLGGTYADGGYVTMKDDAQIFTTTAAHELGHNIGLQHANAPAGEYFDLYDVMGLAVKINGLGFPPSTLDTARRDQLGLDLAGEIEVVTEGQQVSRTLSARSAGSGLRGLEVRRDGTSYWVEWRNGSGRDDGTFYETWPTQRFFGNTVYNPGVTVVTRATGGRGETALQTITTDRQYGARVAGQTFTAGDLTITVGSIGTSSATVSVTNGPPPAPDLPAATPTVSGTPVVDGTLTAGTAGWEPGATFAYQWRSAGTDVAGATDRTFSPRPADVGKTLTVRVTGSKSGFSPSTRESAPTSAVARGTLAPVDPTVSGNAAVGGTLTATTPAWGPGSVALVRQWRVDGVDVQGETGTTFSPRPADVGRTVTVRVTGTKDGYTSTTRDSAPTAAVAEGTLVAATPTIGGAPVVDGTLTAATGIWTAGTSFAYQWRVDGTDVAGATSRTFEPRPADVGRRVTVRVTGTSTGYAPTTRESDPTSPVATATLSTSAPTVSGSPVVDGTLTAVPGSWTSGTTFTYQWRVAGQAVDGATSSTFSPRAADVGSTVTVVVTGTKDGYATTTRQSTATAAVAAASLSSSTPTVAGTPVVDGTLTASTGAWTSGTTFTYQWRVAGQAVGGATSSTFSPRAADVGSTVTVVVTGTKDGYASTSRESAATSAVARATLSSSRPTIAGSPVVDGTLVASTGTWTAGTLFEHQWAVDGTDVTGATGTTFSPRPGDVGRRVTVRVTGSRPGYTTRSETSTASDPVAEATLSPQTPTVSGTARVGSTLTAATPAWGPGTVTLARQWRVGGTAVPGETGPTFVPRAEDVGRPVTVVVTGTRAGYATGSRESDATAAVAEGVLEPVTPTVSGSAAVGSTLTATTPAWGPGTVALARQWRVDGADVTGATGTTFVPRAQDVGRTVTVRVTGTRSGYATASRESDATAAVAEGVLEPVTPTVSGSAAVGGTLTATTPAWGPGTVALARQWRVGGVDVDGATGTVFRPRPQDVGKAVTLRVTGTRSGYATTSRDSDPTDAVRRGVMTSAVPTISGSRVVDGTLTAGTTGWDAQAALAYAWLVDGEVVEGATGRTFSPRPQDVGQDVVVRVTGTRDGYADAVESSEPTGPVEEALLTSGTPTVSGPPVVDGTLTADPGTWTSDATFAYRWLVDGTVVDGETGSTYRPRPGDVGRSVSVVVTGSRPGYTSEEVESASTDAVREASLTSATPTIAGRPVVDGALVVSTGSWTSGTSFTRQWLVDGVEVTGATGTTFAPRAADVGRRVTVRVTGSRPGYASRTETSAPTDAVAPAELASATPTISGPASVGGTLAVDPGSWTPGTTFAHQWLVGGVEVPGATGTTFVPRADDVGQRVTVRTTGSRPGHASRTETSAPTAPVQPGTLTAPTPVVSGDAVVGSMLTVATGTWQPDPVALSRQWRVDGADVTGATGPSFAPRPEDVGRTITVRVTGTKAGYATRAVESAPTAAVARGTLAAARPTVSGTPVVDGMLTAATSGWDPAATLAYQWRVGGTDVDGATSRTFSPRPADADRTVTVVVTGTRDGYGTERRESVATAAVARAALVAGTPAVAGTPVVDGTLTASTGDWTDGTSFAFQWRVDGVDVGGATGSTFVPRPVDVGEVVTVRVTGSRPGYTTTSRTSGPTAPVASATFTAGSVAVVGDPVVDGSLTVSTDGWPAEAVLARQWQVDGVDVGGATGSTFVLRPVDLGEVVTVRVTGTRAGYSPASRTSEPTAAVRRGTLVVGTPAVTGSPVVGSTLTSTTGDWSPGTTLTRQWRVGGEDVEGATAATFVPRESDVGAPVTVVVSGTRPGYADVSAESAPTGPVTRAPARTWRSVSAGALSTCAIGADRSLSCWGENASGRLGDGTATDRVVPTRVGTATDWASVSVGGAHACAVTTTSRLLCWGENGSGQLGVGSTTDRSTPVRVGSASDWSSVTAGAAHTCATKKTGRLYCWGSNGSGRIGDGTTTTRRSPVQVGTATDWRTVSAGSSHTCAVRKTGARYCWGANTSRQLGSGTTTATKPRLVGSGGASVTTGDAHACSISTASRLACWGANASGQVGNGRTASSVATPVAIGSGTWRSVDGGAAHTCGVTSTGGLSCWGSNGSGRLGDGTGTSRSAPTAVGRSSTWSAVSAGGQHTCALTSDAQLFCWGAGAIGQLGQGDRTSRNVPTPVR